MTEAPSRPVRRESRLRLRRPAEIALAFVFGPAAGLTVLFMLMLVSIMVDPRDLNPIPRLMLAFFYVYLLIFGGIVCLAVELVVITPLLIGFHRYRWRWLNGWTGALIGFALAFLPTLLLVELAPHTDRPDAWILGIVVSVAVGIVGLVAAGVFRLLAVRRASDAEDVLS
jgi:hypothetical protein